MNGSSLALRLTSYARRASFYKQKKILLIRSGHSFIDRFYIPEGIRFKLIRKRFIHLYSFDPQKLDWFGRLIFKLKPADPYKGGGIRYVGRPIRLKKRRVKL
jgi:ribosomal protein L6P/L9E